jgi:hypothetical protein
MSREIVITAAEAKGEQLRAVAAHIGDPSPRRRPSRGRPSMTTSRSPTWLDTTSCGPRTTSWSRSFSERTKCHTRHGEWGDG